MRLSECTYGIIVKSKSEDRIGMVVGITTRYELASYEERKGVENAIPLVQWSDGATCGIHQGNIEKFKG